MFPIKDRFDRHYDMEKMTNGINYRFINSVTPFQENKFIYQKRMIKNEFSSFFLDHQWNAVAVVTIFN